MKDHLITISALAIPFGLMAAGVGILVWLAPVPASELTPVQARLIELGDTVTKVTLGAIFAIAGFLFMRRD